MSDNKLDEKFIETLGVDPKPEAKEAKEAEEEKVEKSVKSIKPKKVALTSDAFNLELRPDGFYNVRSRDTNMLLIVGASEEEVLKHYT